MSQSILKKEHFDENNNKICQIWCEFVMNWSHFIRLLLSRFAFDSKTKCSAHKNREKRIIAIELQRSIGSRMHIVAVGNGISIIWSSSFIMNEMLALCLVGKHFRKYTFQMSINGTSVLFIDAFGTKLLLLSQCILCAFPKCFFRFPSLFSSLLLHSTAS